MRTHLVMTLASIVLTSPATLAQPFLAPPPSGVQVTTSNGIEFSTIGAPGNRATTPQEAPTRPIGSVANEYRIARTELTANQYLEFAQAYVRWNPQQSLDTNFLGGALFGTPSFGVVMSPVQNPNGAVAITWRWAARYCNWLHNDKADAPWAFESGAYDTSTFITDPTTGVSSDQATRSPGARYWIPSRDEWVKANYFDPDKAGPGVEGYWRYPLRSDQLPISGLPFLSGQTSAGLNVPSPQVWIDVGAYERSQSPWGLFDGSGGLTEWTEAIEFQGNGVRYMRGSRYGSPLWGARDLLDSGQEVSAFTNGSVAGLRIAGSSIPAPSCGLLFAGLVFFRRYRRRISHGKGYELRAECHSYDDHLHPCVGAELVHIHESNWRNHCHRLC
ncbi:MAG: SUMF1/EgtB/PvdO family nonheme iron enzyme [Phycisphaerales bacterium]|nr:SUMF1/EgtB/PvdO family nonheme iron enzyme [Phycisphaerales bacterium]